MRWMYVTFPSEESAVGVGRVLVEERLAGCANVLPGVASIYRWEGEVVEDREAVLIVKTVGSREEEVRARVVELHPYSCPCILSFSPSECHGPWLGWLAEETAGG